MSINGYCRYETIDIDSTKTGNTLQVLKLGGWLGLHVEIPWKSTNIVNPNILLSQFIEQQIYLHWQAVSRICTLEYNSNKKYCCLTRFQDNC